MSFITWLISFLYDPAPPRRLPRYICGYHEEEFQPFSTSSSRVLHERLNMPAENTQTFSFETVAVLVATIKDKGGNLGMKDYELMASLDASRSASGFDHLFRKVKARANELLEAKKNGAVATPTKNAKGASAGGKKRTPATGEKKRTPATGDGSPKKRGKKGKKDDDDDDDELEDEESPTKKVKVEAVADSDHELD